MHAGKRRFVRIASGARGTPSAALSPPAFLDELMTTHTHRNSPLAPGRITIMRWSLWWRREVASRIRGRISAELGMICRRWGLPHANRSCLHRRLVMLATWELTSAAIFQRCAWGGRALGFVPSSRRQRAALTKSASLGCSCHSIWRRPHRPTLVPVSVPLELPQAAPSKSSVRVLRAFVPPRGCRARVANLSCMRLRCMATRARLATNTGRVSSRFSVGNRWRFRWC